MQVTITLNHLFLIFISGFLLGIVLYAVQIYKKICKELSVAAAKIFHYQGRLMHIAKQLESIAVNVQYIREVSAGETGSLQTSDLRHRMKLSDCLTKLTKALIC